MSARVGKGLIGVRLARGIEWDRSRSVRMAIEVSRMKKADTSAGRYPPEAGRVSLESARRGESNGIGLEASACLSRPVAINLKVLPHGTQVQKYA